MNDCPQPPILKDPLASINFDFRFVKRLGSDTITSFSLLNTAGLTVESPAPFLLAGNQIVRARFSGGTLGAIISPTCRVVTAGGRTIDLTQDFEIARTYRPVVKDPDATIDLAVDWNLWLTANAATIASSAWQGVSGISVSGGGHSSGVATGWVSGGTHANNYEALNLMTASDGQIEVYAFKVFVQQQ